METIIEKKGFKVAVNTPLMLQSGCLNSGYIEEVIMDLDAVIAGLREVQKQLKFSR